MAGDIVGTNCKYVRWRNTADYNLHFCSCHWFKCTSSQDIYTSISKVASAKFML